MSMLPATFWVCAACVLYAYVGYPLLLMALGRCQNRREPRRERFTGTVSVILPVHNEEAELARRLHEFTDLFQANAIQGELIVVSDGSTDRTASIAREFKGGRVQVIELARNQGKAAALSAGCLQSRHDILVLA